MESRFTAEFFAGNRQRLRALFTGTAPIVITANGLLQRGGDNAFNFAQDANFWYLTGIDEPDIILVLDRDKEYLIIPARDASREAFDGAITDRYVSKRSGIKNVLESKAGWEQLGNRLKKVKHVAVIAAPPAYIEHFGLYTNPARSVLVSKLKEHNESLEFLDLSSHMSLLRMIKQPEELAAIQSAINITVSSIKKATAGAKIDKYKFEYQLEAELSKGFRQRGAKGHAFDPVVASGVRACTLHNVANSGTIEDGDFIITDVGAEVEHYAADLTRTFIKGEPSKRQRLVYAAVLDVQAYAFSLLKPGVMLKDYEHTIEQYMGEKLRELGLIKTINHDNVRKYFPHATSHFLGLNVHDIGLYDRPLEKGVVLAVEPGIYIPKEKIGVRIEDNVLITANGIKNLSDKLSKELL